MDIGASSILMVALACVVMYVVVGSLQARSNKLPPGPSLVTIMRNSFELYQKPQQTMAKLAKLYGPIMRLKIGQATTIIISSANAAKEILHTHDALFSDRTNPDITTAYNHNNYSLVFLPYSPLWQELRKICHGNLFSKKTLDASQDLRRKKLQGLLNDIRESSLKGEAVDVGRAAFMTCINFLSYTFVSQDFVESLGNEEYKHVVGTLLKATGTPNLVDYLPMLRMFDPQGIRRHTTNYIDKLFHILDPIIDERIKLRNGKHYVTNNDMLDILLQISEGDSQKMTRKQIKHLFLDLLVAGTDTTAYGLERTMTELIHNPEAMAKAKKELEETVGIGNPVEESDIGRLPYLQAVIKESLRLHPPAPLLLPRRAKIDVQVCGYTIPKGSQVLINEWAIGRNPNIWDNAHVFSPERFLGSDIDVKGHNFQLTPFGSGRRICPGSPLAIRMLHLMLGSLINSFDWKLENNLHPKDMHLDQPLRAIPLLVNDTSNPR
ncbi:geraniol 8-hydroxylase-like [Abrus precatorius]|uniref:Geraniol 8-hydroxylase-like n=1 Tax=Abrus precatorius TaxID=3816 RepID=A0A8B8MEK5_ABRPR|nr:geraniol 8-hydroxylase-like [Abrus precatorius]XP_027367131.1 geraniol 8-hydroxylase-like [Abrus precatorius]